MIIIINNNFLKKDIFLENTGIVFSLAISSSTNQFCEYIYTKSIKTFILLLLISKSGIFISRVKVEINEILNDVIFTKVLKLGFIKKPFAVIRKQINMN
jgi:hypothetical protein